MHRSLSSFELSRSDIHIFILKLEKTAHYVITAGRFKRFFSIIAGHILSAECGVVYKACHDMFITGYVPLADVSCHDRDTLSDTGSHVTSLSK